MPVAEEIQREGFGPNEWLVDEMYHRYQENPKAVGESWQEFFADYAPKRSGRIGTQGAQGGSDGSASPPVADRQAVGDPVAPSERE
ncbi:MAG: hypothetical protein H0T12_08535, partial [Actinobacteria bacterium]|nr:hypothetical protein [Actinomycetota bacterium]